MSRPRLLVADDDSLVRAHLSAVLRKDFIVALAGDGNEAVRKATEHPPDCALIDVQMPEMNGIQTLRAFRTHAVLRKVPVIILSADNSRATVMSAITGGAADYLVKGNFEDAALIARVKRAVELAKTPLSNVPRTLPRRMFRLRSAPPWWPPPHRLLQRFRASTKRPSKASLTTGNDFRASA